MTFDSKGSPGHPHGIKIRIDREAFDVTSEEITGAGLRALPTPPVGPDRDLYEIRPGQDDSLISNDEVVRVREGQRFFTAPGRINPGQPR
jgi:hypothetical protein